MATVKAMVPNKAIIVARSDIHAGKILTEDDLVIKKYPASVIPDGAVADKKGVKGKTLKKDIFQGEVLRIKHLSSASPLPAQLEGYCPEGWGAVELPLGTAQGMISLKPGDKINIYGEVPTVQGNKVVSTVDVIAEDAVVLVVPQKEGRDTFVIAVAPESIPAVAEAVVRDKKLAVAVINR